MRKTIMLFAGTTEGRKLCEYLTGKNCDTYVYVTTEYGRELLPQADNVHIQQNPAWPEKACRYRQDGQKRCENCYFFHGSDPPRMRDTVVPAPTRLSNRSCAPWALAIRWHRASPRPAPPWALARDLSTM